MLALIPHPALITEAAGIDTSTRKARGSFTSLRLGNLGIEHQVEDPVKEQPVIYIHEGSKAAGGRRRKRSPGSQDYRRAFYSAQDFPQQIQHLCPQSTSATGLPDEPRQESKEEAELIQFLEQV